jgi:hypothetical protein
VNRIVLDASAGVELLLNTTRARSLSVQFPAEAEWWVPEHYFVEVAGALRRAELNGNASPSQVGRAFAMLSEQCFAESRSARCCPMRGSEELRSLWRTRCTWSSLSTLAPRS